MKEFLEHARGAGVLDSEGHFTLDMNKAMEKLGRFQLPEPGYFVLKGIQAGVAAGAPEVKVRASRWTTRVEFQADLSPVSNLFEWLTGERDELTRPQRQLVIGLLAAPGPWTLKLGTTVLKWDQQRLSVSEESGPEELVCWEVKGGKGVAEVVRRQARFSVTPVLLNGKSCLAGWETTGPRYRELGDSADWVQVLSPGEGLRLPALPLAELEQLNTLWAWRGTRRWSRKTAFAGRRPCWLTMMEPPGPIPDGELRLRRVLRWPVRRAANMEVTFVVDGVALPPFIVANSTMDGYEVLEHAPWALTDVSGFKVNQDDERFAQFMAEALASRARMEALFLRHLGRFGPVVRGRSRPPGSDYERGLFRVVQEMLRTEGELGPTPVGNYLLMGVLREGLRLGWDIRARDLVQLRQGDHKGSTLTHRGAHYRVEDLSLFS